jgi:hypothetical protein
VNDAIKPAIAPAAPARLVRCPLATHSYRFKTVCRCVQDDTHAGTCKTIDGSDLTAEAYSPRMRYVLMDLEPPAELPGESAGVA